MDKTKLKALICNKIWIYQFLSDQNNTVLLYLGTEKNSGFLTLEFLKNGEIEIPTKVGFRPAEYRLWDFDEARQEIIFMNQAGQEQKRAQLPKGAINGMQIINFHGDKKEMLVDVPHNNQSKVESRILGGRQMFFLPREFFQQSAFRNLSHAGFNVKLLDTSERMDFFNKVYEYVIQHPQLEQLVVSRTGDTTINSSRNDFLLFKSAAGMLAFDWFSGKRALLIEFLIVVLTENNQRQLNPNDHRSGDEMLKQVLVEKFAGRYEVE